MRTKRNFTENLELLEDYAKDNPDLECFIRILKKLQESKNAHIRITVGKREKENMFTAALTSEVMKPQIIFTSYRGTPQIMIKSFGANAATVLFSLPKISNLYVSLNQSNVVRYGEISHEYIECYKIEFKHGRYGYQIRASIVPNDVYDKLR